MNCAVNISHSERKHREDMKKFLTKAYRIAKLIDDLRKRDYNI